MLLLPEVIGSLAIVVMLASLFGLIRSHMPEARAQIILGFSFGLVAMIQMNAPLEMAPGVIIDMRNVSVALAGAFLGWRAALICLVMAASMRGYIGGVGMASGLAGMLVSFLAGFLWNHWTLRQSRRGIVSMIVLGLVTSLHLTTALLMPWDLCVAFLSTLALPMAVLNLLSIPVAATFLEHERFRALVERRHAAERRQDPISGLTGFETFSRDAIALSHGDAHTSIAGVVAVRVAGRRSLAHELGAARYASLLSAIRVRLDNLNKAGLPIGATVDGQILMGLNFHQIADLPGTEVKIRRLLNDQAYIVEKDVRLRIGITVQSFQTPNATVLESVLHHISMCPSGAPIKGPSKKSVWAKKRRQDGDVSDNNGRHNGLFDTARVLRAMK